MTLISRRLKVEESKDADLVVKRLRVRG
jgi:hypothetical protein